MIVQILRTSQIRINHLPNRRGSIFPLPLKARRAAYLETLSTYISFLNSVFPQPTLPSVLFFQIDLAPRGQ